MKKLLQINVVSNVLSTGKITNDLAAVAQERGWETYIAYGRYAKPGVSREIRVGTMMNTYLHYASNRLFDREGLASRRTTKAFLKQIDAIKPDIIHLHNIHDHYINYPLLFRYLETHDIPVVWTQHDCWSFTGGCVYYDLFHCMKWKEGCHHCPEKRALLTDRSSRNYRLKKEWINRMDKIVLVPVSEWLAEVLRVSSIKGKDIRVIHNGVDINAFRPVPGRADDRKFRILGVAAPWSVRKGLPDFCRLRALLPEEYQITLVGLTKEQIRDLPSGITGIERTSDREELVRLYSESDVFINPTYSDNLPTTNIEALACGTPVITYNTGGSAETVDENTGIVVEQGDLEGVIRAIETIKANGKAFYSPSCRERAVRNFDRDQRFEDYLRLYEELTAAKC